MAAAYVELPGIGDRVYQNMVRSRYRVCVQVAGRHVESFLQVDPEGEKKSYNKQQKSESSTCGVVVYCL